MEVWIVDDTSHDNSLGGLAQTSLLIPSVTYSLTLLRRRGLNVNLRAVGRYRTWGASNILLVVDALQITVFLLSVGGAKFLG